MQAGHQLKDPAADDGDGYRVDVSDSLDDGRGMRGGATSVVERQEEEEEEEGERAEEEEEEEEKAEEEEEEEEEKEEEEATEGEEREWPMNGGSQLIRRSKEEASCQQNDIKAAVSITWVAPDGGWGWMVMVSALCISIIVDGLTYTFGLFLGQFEEEFEAPKSTVSLAGSLQVGVYLMVGPIVSALTNRFGCRSVIIAGSLVTSTAFVVSSFSPSISVLIATYGFFGGMGFGMMYLPAIVAVSVYFERRRALATGIAVCGSGIGTFILAPLTKFLLFEYNWRWTLVILGGFILNAMVCGALIRPLEPIARSVSPAFRKDSVGSECRQRRLAAATAAQANNKNSDSSEHNRTSGSGGKRKKDSSFSGSIGSGGGGDAKEMIPLITVTDETDITKIVLSSQQKKKDQQVSNKSSIIAKNKNSQNHSTSLTPNRQNNQPTMLFSSVPNMVGSFVPEKASTAAVTARLSPQARKPFENAQSYSVTDVSAWKSRARSQTVDAFKSPLYYDVEPKAPKENLPIGLSFIGLSDAQVNKIRDDIALRVSRRDISRSVSLIPQDFNVINQEGYITSIVSINSLATSRAGDIGGGLWNSLKDTLQEMLDFGILKDRRYLFVLLGNFFCMIGFYVPFVYIPERARELGIPDDQAAFLISIIGITNIIGRVATGVVVNFLKIDSLLITSLALLLCGLVTAVCPLCQSYPALIGVSTGFGLGVAAYISLCSILLCELLGVKNLTNAFGFVILFRGVASTIGPPIAGALIDTTGLFDPAFYLGGAMIVLGAVSHFVLFVPCLKEIQHASDKRDN